MLQRTTHILATLASLAAILVGLAGGWEFWAVVKRAAVGYLGVYLVCGSLLVLGRFALQAGHPKASGTAGKGREAEATRGTDAAP